jgi:hypothetical protein
MKYPKCILSVILAGAFSLSSNLLFAGEKVTIDNFVRAETDMTLKRYKDQGAFGTVMHLREPTPIDKQGVIRMNRDTLYSFGIFDLTTPVTIIKPSSSDRFQSLLIINQDHSMRPVIHGPAKVTLTRKNVGTRYVFVFFRTFMEPANPSDIKAAHQLQDQIKAIQKSAGEFDIPDWDEASLKTVREAINVLASTKVDASAMFGDKAKLNPIEHLLGTAYGWGGNPKEAAFYINGVPTNNDGKTPYAVTVKNVPVNGFWSVTVYNAQGFMEKNDLDAYSYNNISAKKNNDGSITINFGGDPKKPNYLPIMPGWNYVVRLYQPKADIIKGKW